MGTEHDEQVMMTVKSKTPVSTTLIIERRLISDANEKMHVAGGEHTGIIINKETTKDNGILPPAQVSLEFRVFLINSQTTKQTQESRTLRFWFRRPGHTKLLTTDCGLNAANAQDFFRELVNPQEFPRDYVGFIKKIMKLMQRSYETIDKLEVQLTQLPETEMPTRPHRHGYLQIDLNSVSAEENSLTHVSLTADEILRFIEWSYPNPLTIQDICRDHDWDEKEVRHYLNNLQNRGLIKEMDHGAFTRQQSHDTQVIVVKQMPTVASSKQPTIAIITAQYCEKLAVDSMIENKETFVRYTTVGPTSPTGDPNRPRFGESNVYTLGNIGPHRIVCTKLPSVGHTREAMTAAGNTTTRLLGTFQKVDYVFLVGVGGGVPHYTDYNKHVRLGDVVISCPIQNKFVYTYCESVRSTDKGYEFEIKTYTPTNLSLQNIALNLIDSYSNVDIAPPWMNFLNDGLNTFRNQDETDFHAPNTDTDKLYMTIGENELIEVTHPTPPQDNFVRRRAGCPRVHLAAIASGRKVVKDDQLRQHFASQVGALGYDCEFDAVIESILGNCKESFIIIRGISDYKDGTRRKEWQPYASLAAASVMKSIISEMLPVSNS